MIHFHLHQTIKDCILILKSHLNFEIKKIASHFRMNWTKHFRKEKQNQLEIKLEPSEWANKITIS